MEGNGETIPDLRAAFCRAAVAFLHVTGYNRDKIVRERV
jgi:hypothetical protein